MKKSIFAVCDLEASYAYNLMEAIDETRGVALGVQAFTNVERLIAYAGERHIELLLISAAAMCGELLKLSIGKIMILSEGEKKKELSEYPCIYKYSGFRSADRGGDELLRGGGSAGTNGHVEKEGGDRWYLFSGRPVHENLSGADLRTASGTGTQGFVSESGGICRF